MEYVVKFRILFFQINDSNTSKKHLQILKME